MERSNRAEGPGCRGSRAGAARLSGDLGGFDEAFGGGAGTVPVPRCLSEL